MNYQLTADNCMVGHEATRKCSSCYGQGTVPMTRCEMLNLVSGMTLRQAKRAVKDWHENAKERATCEDCRGQGYIAGRC